MLPKMVRNLALFGRWTLRDEAPQRRLCQTLGVISHGALQTGSSPTGDHS